MSKRAADLIRSLGLKRHPEGGHFREIFRSPRMVETREDRRKRCALTAIYYLVPEGDPSRWHTVESDEIWHFLEGADLELLTVEPKDLKLDRSLLGPATGAREPIRAVPAGRWQAARSTGAFTLAGCSVGPGFEFEDFRLLREDPEMKDRLLESFPDLADLL